MQCHNINICTALVLNMSPVLCQTPDKLGGAGFDDPLTHFQPKTVKVQSSESQ